MGIYKIPFLNLQFSALIQRVIFDYSIFALVLFLVLLLGTLIFGRFYCSVICPFGILQESADLIYSKFRSKKESKYEYIAPKPYKYYIAALVLGLYIGGSAVLIKYIDPYTMFGSFATHAAYGTIFTITVLAIVFYKNRIFCSSICPIGTILGLLSRFSPLNIHINDNCINCGACEKNCPVKCINKDNKIVNNENCIKCLKCTSVCPKGAIKYGFKLKYVPFNINKRKALVSGGALALFAGAYALGIKFSKDLYSKIKKIILPAGATDVQTMANKCLNCNLCIKNCPKGILEKANKDCPTIHIEYSKGEHYCDYNCKKCSEVCPSGAIKKITLNEKQNTRIALAYINQYCISCSQCVSKCPKGAISVVEGVTKIDSSKCIGCGICKSVCPMSAIDIFSINKQTEI